MAMPSDRSPRIAYSDLMRSDEDWTKLQNNVERRKIQNRIAQRAYRRNARARTNEVQVLKDKIRELQGSAGDEYAFVVKTPTNTLPQPQDARSNSHCDDNTTVSSSTEENDASWQQSCSTSSMDVVTTAPITQSPWQCEPSSSLSYHSIATSIPWSCQPQLPFTTTAQSVGQPTMRWEQNPSFERNGQDVPFPSCFSVQAPGSANNPGALAGGDLYESGEASSHPISMVSSTDRLLPLTGSDAALRLDSSPRWSSTLPTTNVKPTQPEPAPRECPPSLLHLAVASGDVNTLRILLENLDLPTDMRDAAGYTPLQRAVMSGRSDLVTVLLGYGADFASETRLIGSMHRHRN